MREERLLEAEELKRPKVKADEKEEVKTEAKKLRQRVIHSSMERVSIQRMPMSCCWTMRKERKRRFTVAKSDDHLAIIQRRTKRRDVGRKSEVPTIV